VVEISTDFVRVQVSWQTTNICTSV